MDNRSTEGPHDLWFLSDIYTAAEVAITPGILPGELDASWVLIQSEQGSILLIFRVVRGGPAGPLGRCEWVGLL